MWVGLKPVPHYNRRTITMLEIRLLGELELQRDGESVPLPPSKKTRALLAYLIATGKPQLRDRICELLWEGPDDPRAELRWSLSKLRLALENHLSADRERIEFHPEGATIDLHQFRRLLGRGVEHASVHDLYRAAQLVRGEFLEGLELPACYRFQQWLQGERESLRQIHVAVLARMVELLGPTDDALAHARRRAMIDPFTEEAHIALIRLLAALDRNQEAIRQYEHCRLLFERELGRRPSEAVEDARRACRSGLSPTERTEVRSTSSSEHSLIGRREELKRARNATDKIVLITGEPGIGKSRMLGEICGGNAIYGRAFAAEMIRPYGIWIDALADSGGFPTDISDQTRLFDRVVDIVKSSGRAVLALDDLQWLDEASAALLHYASRAIRGTRIFLAARSGELEANEAACRVIRELSREKRLLQLQLQPLTAGETRELVLRIGPETDVERAVAESAGNPLFAIELARATAASESTTLDQLLADRLSDLDPRARELVPWAAALGRHFDVEILGRATGMPSGEMMAALETLERCAILRAAPNANRYDFTHDLIRGAAYHKLSGPRKYLVHRQIAQALHATHDPDSALAGDIVHHASLGGDLHLAAHSAADAGHRCLRLFAYGEAMAVARQGLQIADSLPDEVRIDHQLQLLYVIALSRISIKERIGWQPRVEILLAQARGRKMMREAALGAHILALFNADREDFAGAADRTIESAELIRDADPSADPSAAGGVIANTGRCLLFLQREVPRARLLLEEAEKLAAHSATEYVEIPLGLGFYYAHVGDDVRAIPQLERAQALATRDQDHWREWIAIYRLVIIALERGDAANARRLCERLGPIAAKMSGGSEGPVTEMLTALANLIAGDDSDVERCLQSLRQIDSKGELAYALVFLAERDLQRGDSAAARARAEEALRAAEVVDRRSEAAIARSLLAEITGDRSILDAVSAMRQWDDLTKRAQDRLTEAKHGTHRSRTVVRKPDHIRTAQ